MTKTAVQDSQLATVQQEPSVGALMQQVISASGGITTESVSVMERLIAMRRDMKADDAKEAFSRAFVAMRKEMQPVQAMREVEGRYFFAAFEDIRKQADPILAKYGFAVSFDTQVEDNRLTSICDLMHEGGHSKQNRFAVRFSKPPGTNDSQGDMSTKSYAQRGAFCDCVGIVISKDTDGSDARGLGDRITPDQAEDLERRVTDLGRNAKAFLDFADATSFEDIHEAAYTRCDKWLTKAENMPRKRAQTPGDAPCDENGNLL